MSRQQSRCGPTSGPGVCVPVRVRHPPKPSVGRRRIDGRLRASRCALRVPAGRRTRSAGAPAAPGLARAIGWRRAPQLVAQTRVNLVLRSDSRDGSCSGTSPETRRPRVRAWTHPGRDQSGRERHRHPEGAAAWPGSRAHHRPAFSSKTGASGSTSSPSSAANRLNCRHRTRSGSGPDGAGGVYPRARSRTVCSCLGIWAVSRLLELRSHGGQAVLQAVVGTARVHMQRSSVGPGRCVPSSTQRRRRRDWALWPGRKRQPPLSIRRAGAIPSSAQAKVGWRAPPCRKQSWP